MRSEILSILFILSNHFVLLVHPPSHFLVVQASSLREGGQAGSLHHKGLPECTTY